MLNLFRDKRVVKRIFWTLVIAIIPAFALWESGSRSRSKETSPTYVGTIDNERVSFDELSKNIAGIRTQLILNYWNQPETLEQILNNKPFIAKLGWERLILLREAKTRNIAISDKRVIDYIRTIFVKDGRFDLKLYEYALKHTFNLGARAFEEIARENLLIQKLKDSISKDIKVSEEEILKAYQRDTGKIKITYILVSIREFLDKANVDDDAVKRYYENNKLEFMPSPPREGENIDIANFKEATNNIRKYLIENEARRMAFEYIVDLYKKIVEVMEKENMTFEGAASKFGLKITESPFFSKSDRIEGLGEADYLMGAALALTKPDQISNPIETTDGIIIFKISKIEDIDEEKYKKEKDFYSKKVLETKKIKRLDELFQKISPRTRLRIDFQNIEKYHPS